jgi:hypothetical protein
LIDSAKAMSTNACSIPGRTLKPSARALATAALAAILVVLVVLNSPLESWGATVDPATLTASKSLEAKMQTLGSKDTQPLPSYPAVIITENEANSYLKVHSGEFLPAGVGTPSVKIQPEHAIVTGNVNFDELSRLYPNQTDMGPKILAAMFHGTQHVTIAATIKSQPAGVLVQVESIMVGSTTVPKWLVDYMIQNVLQPKYHFDLSKPFPYPDHVKQVVLGSGQVTFLRGPKGGK